MTIDIKKGYLLVGSTSEEYQKAAKKICNTLLKLNPNLQRFIKTGYQKGYVVFGENLYRDPSALISYDFDSLFNNETPKIDFESFYLKNCRPKQNQVPPDFGVVNLGFFL